MVCVLIGIAIALGSLTPWLVVPVFVALISINVIPVEESMLADAFGDAIRWLSHARATVAVNRGPRSLCATYRRNHCGHSPHQGVGQPASFALSESADGA